MTGTGTTNVAASGALNISGNISKILERTLTHGGMGTWTGTGTWFFGTNSTFNNNGTFDLQSDADTSLTGNVPCVFNNAGTLTKSAGTGTNIINIPFNNSGTVNANSGTLQFSGSYTQTAGITRLNGGTISLSAITMNIQGGALEGNGTVSGNASNSGGTVRPGLSPGDLTINGNYMQGAAGALNVEVGGLTAGTQFDQLNVTGSATLAGTLNVTLINNFSPSLNNTFPILNFASRSGAFGTTNLPALSGNLGWNVRYDPTAVTLEIVMVQAAPVITSINPSSGQQAARIQTFTINGMNLTGTTSTNFLLGGNPDNNITASNIVVVNDTQATATVDIDIAAALGNRVVTATNAAGTSSPIEGNNNRFTVNPPPLVVNSINPTQGQQGDVNLAFTINGTAFTGATDVLFLFNGVNDTAITHGALNVNGLGTQITTTLNIGANVQRGNHVVVVVTPGGQSSSTAGANNTFNVLVPPAITSINPNNGQQGQTIQTFTFNGTNFTGATGVNFLLSGNPDPNITVSNFNVVNDTAATATVAIGANAVLGDHVVTITTPDGTSTTTAGANNTFNVMPPPPTIASINPNNGQQGTTIQNLTIVGTNLMGATAVSFLLNGNPDPDITVSNLTVVNNTQATATIAINANAQTGDRVVTVTTPSGTSSATAGVNNTFAVIAPPPTVTAANPNQGQQGETLDVTLTGASFQNGATVNFGADITVNNTTVNSSTQITANLTIAGNATVGTRNVTVTNPDNQMGTLTNGFTIVSSAPPAPTITSISPASAAPGQSNVTFTINGTNLTGANAISFLLNGNLDPNITVSNIVVVNDTQVTATVNVSRDASAGDRVVTVTTPGGTANANVAFSVLVTLPPIPGNRVMMVSVPINAPNLDPLSVFGANAQAARYTGNNQYLLRSSGFFPVVLGEGYFVKLPADFTPSLTAGTLAPNNAPFDIPLPDNDWFIVGNPFLAPVNVDVNQLQFVIGGVATPLTNVVGDVNGAVTFYGWKWNPDRSDYDLVCDPNVIPGAVSTLGVGEAMFIRTKQAGVSLRIPVPVGHPQLAKRSKRQRSASDWSFRLVTTAGGAVDANTYLGMSNQGKAQGIKVAMPPALIARQGYVETSFVNASADGKAQRWKADLRAGGGQQEEWIVEVHTDQRNADVTLSWNDLSHVPKQYRLRLTDLTTGEKRALRTTSGYTFRSSAEGETVRRFRVELYPTTDGGLKVNHLNVNLQNGLGAHVSFTLNRPARVQMTVLNPTGKAVRVLPPLEGRVGLNALTWDSKSQTGASLARGLYLLLLRAMDEEGQQVQATRSIVVR